MYISGKKKRKIRNQLKKTSLLEVNLPDIQSLHHQSLKTWIITNRNVLIILTLIVIGLYFYTLNFAFVSDDIFGIVDQNLRDFSKVFANPIQFIRPLVYFITHSIFGNSPWAFRFPNIVSHVLVVLVTYGLIETMVNKQAALFSSLLVAVHPIMIESVTWISGGGHTNYTLFCLISLLFYIIRKNRNSYYWLSVLSFLIALLISEKAMMFPAVILLYQLLFEDLKRDWSQLIPYSVFSGFWAIQYAGLLPQRVSTLETTYSSTIVALNPLVQIPISIGTYLILLVWPDRLTLYHSDLQYNSLQLFFLSLMVVSLAAISVWAWIKSKSKPWLKQIIFWIGVFFISLIPTLIARGVVWLVAERYVYFGALALLVIVGILLDRFQQITKKSDGVILILCILVLSLSIRTIIRNLDWQDTDHLWLSGERTSPNSSQNNNNLGDVYGKRNDPQRALYYFSRAVSLQPCYADAYHNLANTYVTTNQLDQAVVNYQHAIECNPQLWQSHQQLALIYYNQGNFRSALAEINLALQTNPQNEQLLKIQQVIQSKLSENSPAINDTP